MTHNHPKVITDKSQLGRARLMIPSDLKCSTIKESNRRVQLKYELEKEGFVFTSDPETIEKVWMPNRKSYAVYAPSDKGHTLVATYTQPYSAIKRAKSILEVM